MTFILGDKSNRILKGVLTLSLKYLSFLFFGKWIRLIIAKYSGKKREKDEYTSR